MGLEMSARGPAGMAAGAALLGLLSVLPVFAGDHYAIVITGAAGGDAYAQKYDKWRLSFVTTLREKFHYPDDHIVVLADADSAGVLKATRENVRRVLGDLRKRATKDDQILVLLIGHGTSLDGEDAKFNLE